VLRQRVIEANLPLDKPPGSHTLPRVRANPEGTAAGAEGLPVRSLSPCSNSARKASNHARVDETEARAIGQQANRVPRLGLPNSKHPKRFWQPATVVRQIQGPRHRPTPRNTQGSATARRAIDSHRWPAASPAAAWRAAFPARGPPATAGARAEVDAHSRLRLAVVSSAAAKQRGVSQRPRRPGGARGNTGSCRASRDKPKRRRPP